MLRDADPHSHVILGLVRRFHEAKAAGAPEVVSGLAGAVWDPFAHLLRDELRQRRDPTFDARGLQGPHVLISAAHPDDRPWVAACREQRVHQEAADTSVAVVVRMDEDEEMVPEHRANAGFGLRFEHVPQRFQRIQDGLAGSGVCIELRMKTGPRL